MNWFNNLKLTAKMLATFICVALIAGMVGFVGISNIKNLSSGYGDNYDDYGVGSNMLADAAILYQKNRSAFRQVLIEKNVIEKRKFVAEIKDNDKKIEDLMAVYEKHVELDEDRKHLNKLKADISKLNPARDQIIDLVLTGEDAYAASFILGAVQLANVVEADFDSYREWKAKTGLEEDAKLDKHAQSVIITMISIVIGAMVVAIGLGMFMARRIGRPINKLMEAADKMAMGNLNVNIDTTAKDEIGMLSQSVALMAKNISALVADANMLVEAAVAGKLATRADAAKHSGDYRKIVEGVNQTLDAVINPLNVAADYVDKISKGEVPAKITDTYNGDFNTIKNNLNRCIDGINDQVKMAKALADGDLSVKVQARSESDILAISLNVVTEVLQKLQQEIARLTEASKEGELAERGKAIAFQGAYADVISGINTMLDAILLPIGEGNRILSLIRGGDLREKVEIACRGDHQKMKEAVNGVHAWLIELIAYITKMANGDMQATMEKASSNDQIHEWLMLLKQNISALVVDANMLAQAAVEGKLATRADATKHGGDYRKIVEGVNRTLDTLIGHIDSIPSPVMIIDKNYDIQFMNKTGSDIIGIAQQQLIGTKCYSHFKTSHCQTANCACAMAMQQDMVVTQETDAHPRGMDLEISYTAKVVKNDQGQIIGCLELVTDLTVIKRANQIAQKQASYQNGEVDKLLVNLEKLSKGDLNCEAIVADTDEDTRAIGENFSKINNNLQNSIRSIQQMIDDATMLAQAAVEGKLATRADAAKHGGDYRKIVEGVNNTLDSVIGPLNVAADYVDKISKGEIPAKITDNYNGDFNVIKNNLNNCIDNINRLVGDATMLVQAAVDGRLDTRADATKHSGDYRKIVEGVNTTLDEVIKPVKEAAGVLQEMANGNLQRRVQGDYKGDNAAIKNAMNETLDALSAYVTEISAVLGEMANANLDVEIKNDYKGDFSQIKEALNLIVSSFNEAFVEINDAAEQVAAGSSQVAAGSQALSQGSTEQASSIEEITASMTQVADQTKQNALNANQANELAMAARDNAAQGNVQMQDMVKAMSEIDESSTNISKIIKVIDEIAFQTNILALNAAVEAARAGQHGKGFAVVAEEVRNLAARSANAAKETTAMIEGSIKKVETGTVIANQTAKALSAIVDGVAKAAAIVGDIAAASNEQASAINQVNQAIAQVSQVVQTNSATAEESAAASEELSSQAEVMKDNVRKFKLKQNSRAFRSMDTLSPDVLQAIEAMMEKKKAAHQEAGRGRQEIARPSGKPKIALDDHEFGKY